MILIENATLVTQNPARQIIRKGALLIDGKRIADIGSSGRLKKKYAAKDVKKIQGKDLVILPGFVNAHTHAAMSMLRGYADDMPLKQWLEEKIWPAETKLKERDIYRGTRLACDEMIRSGTTTFNNMYWHLKEEFSAVKKCGLRDFVGIMAFDDGPLPFTPEYISNEYEKLKKKNDSKIRLAIAPHSIYAVKPETLKWCKRFADDRGLCLHIHLSETEEEISNCLKKHRCRPVEYLEKIGFLGPNVIAAHVCWVNGKEIKLLAKNKVSVAHCPSSNLKLVSGIMPLSKLLRAGVNVCLGTDGPSSNNALDMFWEMKIAALIHKWNEKNPGSADAQTILDMATINGARALSMEKEIGSLEIGKKADIIIIDFRQPHLQPHHNTVSNIVYAARGADVRSVFIGGTVLF